MPYYVFDPTPTDPLLQYPQGSLAGPFHTKDDADEYANYTHPDDGDGNAIVLREET